MFPRFDILRVLPTTKHILLNGVTRTAWFRSRIQLAMQAQNSKRKDIQWPEDLSYELAQVALSVPPIPASICRWLMIVGEGA